MLRVLTSLKLWEYFLWHPAWFQSQTVTLSHTCSHTLCKPSSLTGVNKKPFTMFEKQLAVAKRGFTSSEPKKRARQSSLIITLSERKMNCLMTSQQWNLQVCDFPMNLMVYTVSSSCLTVWWNMWQAINHSLAELWIMCSLFSCVSVYATYCKHVVVSVVSDSDDDAVLAKTLCPQPHLSTPPLTSGSYS